MKWWKAIWAALVAFFAALRGQSEAQQETQEVIDEVPQMSDDELTDTAVDSGLVMRPGPGPGPGAGRANDLADPDNPYRRYSKTPWKTDRKPDS